MNALDALQFAVRGVCADVASHRAETEKVIATLSRSTGPPLPSRTLPMAYQRCFEVHVAATDGTETPPQYWRTRCGVKSGTGLFSQRASVDAVPGDARCTNCFRFASSTSSLEDQGPCGKELCSFSSEALVCVNFRSLASYWPRPWNDFGVPSGARRPPKGGPETSKRQPQTTHTASLESLWGAFGVPLGAGPPEGGPGASRRQPRRHKMGLPPQRRTTFLKTPKNNDQ